MVREQMPLRASQKLVVRLELRISAGIRPSSTVLCGHSQLEISVSSLTHLLNVRRSSYLCIGLHFHSWFLS